jgi:EAL domain-containing protein (putative c-di-GMP-specific phosphodiesterase class I)
MYRAKRAGGNRVEPFRPAFRTSGTDRLQMESDLRRAIERKELTLAYQPIIKLDNGDLAGFEALMRWEHPKRGPIPPSEFIPIAEASGLIEPLGMFALERAATDLMDWQHAIDKLPIFISVNISSAQLLNNELYNDVRSMLQRTRCNPKQLKLELTESIVMENPEQARLVLAKLKETGLSLALDDFGTGYSSLAYLTRFPFDTIKLDKALVANTSDKRNVLLRSIIAMARALEMQVVAEGIETPEDAAELARMNCHYGQSFLFGTPDTPDAALKLLRERFQVVKRA